MSVPSYGIFSRPNDVFEIAKVYIDAGFRHDCIPTVFGNSRCRSRCFILSRAYGLSDKVYEINKAAAEISRVKPPDQPAMCLVLYGASSGKMIMMGDVTYEEFL